MSLSSTIFLYYVVMYKVFASYKGYSKVFAHINDYGQKLLFFFFFFYCTMCLLLIYISYFIALENDFFNNIRMCFKVFHNKL